VDAIGRARERDIEAIVDDHASRGAARDGKKIGDERPEIGSIEIALANLNDVDAGVGGVPRLRDEAAA